MSVHMSIRFHSPLSPGKSGGVNCDVRGGGKKIGGVPRGAPLVSNTGLNPPLEQQRHMFSELAVHDEDERHFPCFLIFYTR